MTRHDALTDQASGTADEFGRLLRDLRERAGLTQQHVADEVRVRRPTLSQWEHGRHLPSEAKVDQLDVLLRGEGALREQADQARLASDDDVPSTVDALPPRSRRPSLRDVYDNLNNALIDKLVRDEHEFPLGWHHDLTSPGGVPRPQSTAFALRLLILLDGPHVDLFRLGNNLLSQEHKLGGWTSGPFGPRPESTAVVVDALSRLGLDLPIDAYLKRLGELMTEDSWRRVFIVTTVLNTVARLQPGGDLAKTLVRSLMGLRGTASPVGLWPEKAPNAERERVGLLPSPSVPHTARAVIALAPYRDDPEVGDAVDAALDWLAGVDARVLSRENLNPTIDGVRYDDEVRHFTPALVARALSLADDPPWDRVQASLDHVWGHYQPLLGFWTWPNLDTPVWLQYDAVSAIRLAAERHAAPALPVTPQES